MVVVRAGCEGDWAMADTGEDGKEGKGTGETEGTGTEETEGAQALMSPDMARAMILSFLLFGSRRMAAAASSFW